MQSPTRLSLSIFFLFVSHVASGEESQSFPKGEFRETIARILVRNCLDCHHGVEPSGGLDLSNSESLAAGGESGHVIEAGDVEQSLLWQKVSSGEMPPESKLSDQDIAQLRRWIAAGGPWDDRPLDPYEWTTEQRAGYDWWSLQPIVDPPVPDVGREVRNPIDAFVIAQLNRKGLSMSPRADAKTLVRRLSVRLHGIHPDPQVVSRLGKNDTPENFDSLVSEFLSSHRYGERWARHWLDLARFGESQGFERDKSRPNSWRYRDWVINALNDDMPYDQFARMQIAGDCFPDAGAGGVIATGFLVAGAWDEVGQSQQSAAMKAVVRQDELEDYVGTVSQTFLGLTVNCARCHDHKFDPIRQSEYYSLCSALDGVRHGEREITDPEAVQAAQRKKADIKAKLEALTAELAAFERPILESIRKQSHASDAERFVTRPIAHWDFDSDFNDRFGKLHAEPKGGARLEDGALVVDGKQAHAVTGPISEEIAEKTLAVLVSLDNADQHGGGAISLTNRKTDVFDAVVFGEREPKRWMSGSDGFRRTQSVNGPVEEEVTSRPVHIAITYAADGTIKIYRDGVPYGSAYQTDPPPRYDPQNSVVAFGIRHFPLGGNRMLSGRIHEASLFDRVLSEKEVHDVWVGAKFITDEAIVAAMSPQQIGKRETLRKRIEELRSADTSVPREMTYAVNPREPSQPTRLLIRGNTATPAKVVSPVGISSIKGARWDWQLPADAPEADRRRALANWIASHDNPLLARVIVNRLWHHHFGTGFVNTPNDFGFTGGQPSHPELLDYLAARLIESNWSLKTIQRTIVTSATWQQATTTNGKAAAVDASNRLLWRGNRTRLDAETLRDSILLVAGQLNDAQGGPPYQDFKTFNFNSQFYEMLDPVGREFNRRTIYRMVIRSGRNRMLDAFDCPDPSATAPRRAVTTTPLQSLSLMNHSFTLRMADHFAERVAAEAGDAQNLQVERAIQIAWCREPTEAERKSSAEFVSQYGLPAFCRVLFNSNEFLYVD